MSINPGIAELDDTDERVPSYDDALRTSDNSKRPPQMTDSKSDQNSSLSRTLAHVRDQRIQGLAATIILPLLQQQALEAQHRRIYILVPSDWQDVCEPAVKGGVPEKLSRRVVKLSGDEYKAEFFQQGDVISELKHALISRLVEGGNRVAISEDLESQESPGPSHSNPSSQGKKAESGLSKLFSRFSVTKQSAPPKPKPPPMRLGWRSADEDRQPLPPGEVRVDVQLTEVRVSRKNELGGKISLTSQAVLIDFEIGS